MLYIRSSLLLSALIYSTTLVATEPYLTPAATSTWEFYGDVLIKETGGLAVNCGIHLTIEGTESFPDFHTASHGAASHTDNKHITPSLVTFLSGPGSPLCAFPTFSNSPVKPELLNGDESITYSNLTYNGFMVTSCPVEIKILWQPPFGPHEITSDSTCVSISGDAYIGGIKMINFH